MELIPTIGLEVHAQLLTRSKAFCSCPTSYGAPPNAQTCPICLGMPGTLPVANRLMVEMALRLALAVGCSVRNVSQFARKNYFYPDLPKGYQISQYDRPLAENGFLEFDFAGSPRRVPIRRIHLEEDAGKSFHLESGYSLVDMNRCGVPLIEIVSEPDIASPEEARAYLSEIKRIVQFLGICSGNMEEGALRCDANVSVRPEGSASLGVPTEVKNMNSFRGVQRALQFEIDRQTIILNAGGQIVRETLLWDEGAGEARSMRQKELAHDYRYFPEPDLVLLEVSEAWLAQVKSYLPEMPRAREKRLVEQYHIQKQQAQTLCSDLALADYFEAAVGAGSDPIIAANFLLADIQRHLKETGTTIKDIPLESARLSELLKILAQGELSMPLARHVFQEMLTTKESAGQIIHRLGISLVNDEKTLSGLVRRVLQEHPEEVQRYLGGKSQLFGFFMGRLMKETGGKGDPVKLRDLLERELRSFGAK